MLNYDPLSYLPSAQELPSSDDTPVDNELQNLIPNLLLASLAFIWSERMDWFFGVDMGIYYIPNQRYPEPLVPIPYSRGTATEIFQIRTIVDDAVPLQAGVCN